MTSCPRLFELANRAKANGIAGSQMIDASELRDREPHVQGLSALLIPGTAVVDFRIIAEQLAADIVQTGGEVILGHPVMQIDVRAAVVHIATDAHELVFDHLVVCAGLQSSLLARMVGAASDPRDHPIPRGVLRDCARTHRPHPRSRVPGPRPSLSLPRSAFHSRSWWPCPCRTERCPGNVPGRISVERCTASRHMAHRQGIQEREKWRASTGEWALGRYAVR